MYCLFLHLCSTAQQYTLGGAGGLACPTLKPCQVLLFGFACMATVPLEETRPCLTSPKARSRGTSPAAASASECSTSHWLLWNADWLSSNLKAPHWQRWNAERLPSIPEAPHTGSTAAVQTLLGRSSHPQTAAPCCLEYVSSCFLQMQSCLHRPVPHEPLTSTLRSPPLSQLDPVLLCRHIQTFTCWSMGLRRLPHVPSVAVAPACCVPISRRRLPPMWAQPWCASCSAGATTPSQASPPWA